MQNKNSFFVRSIVSVSAVALLRGARGAVSQTSASWIYCASGGSNQQNCTLPSMLARVSYGISHPSASTFLRGNLIFCAPQYFNNAPWNSNDSCRYDDTSLEGTLMYNTSIRSWLRADMDKRDIPTFPSNGTKLDSWHSPALNGDAMYTNVQGNSARRPKYWSNGINGNPVIGFAYSTAYPSDGYYGSYGDNGWFKPSQEGQMFRHVFIVTSLDSSKTSHELFSQSSKVKLNIESGGDISYNYGKNGTSSAVSVPINNTNFRWNKPNLISALYASTTQGGAGAQIKINGKLEVTKTTDNGWAGSWDNQIEMFNLGRMSGSIAEMLVRHTNFNGGNIDYLSAAQKNQIESYLMIKYGIAPQVNNSSLYNTNNGVVWNASTNSTYNNNVFGIGRDMGSSLNSSTSTSTTDPTLSITASTTLTNQQYFLMGDNNASLGWTTSGAPANSQKTNRVWLVQKTGPTNAYTNTFSIPASQIPGYGSAKVYLTVDSNTDFTAGSTSYEMTNTAGVFSVGGVTINNGQYVTITYLVPPATISGRVWIDANKNSIEDSGETSSLSSVTVRLRSCGSYAAGTQPPINYDGGEITSATTTNGAGNYSFTVPGGTYYLEFTIPSTYKFSNQSIAGSNSTNDSDAHPHSGKTKCMSFVSNVTTSNIDVGALTQTYSSCDSLTLSNTVVVGGTNYQKPGVSFTANLAGYGQNATIAGTNLTTATNNGTWRSIIWNQNFSTTVQGQKTITANVDGADYKLDYYNNPSIASLSCPYRTVSAGVFCAQSAPLAPYVTSSLNMNTSPTTIAPISYCTVPQSGLPCTAAIDRPQSALVSTPSTCSQSIYIYDEAAICNSLVTDMSAADCNGLIALYNSAGGASWSNKTNWLFNGDTTWNTACDWYGVTCAGGRLTQVNLPSNNMGGTLPSLPANAWTALTNINFSVNSIGGTLPTAWSTLTAMQYFNIGDTNIGGSLPTQWSTWNQMKGFWCYDARIVSSLPTQWSTWNQLVTFHCGYQQGYSTSTPPYGINGTLPSSWSTMTQLQDLYLHWNKISGQIPTSWSSMTAMRNFALTKNELDGPIPTTVQSWTNLNTNGWNSVLGSNCMGTVGLSAGLTTWLNSRFKGDATTSWNNAASYGWQSQNVCSTDIRITSATITQGDLVNGASATYSITVQNNGSRRSYIPKVTASLGGGLVTSTPTLTYGVLAPGESQTLTMIVTKGSISAGTNNITNTFTLSDTTISDTSTANNTATHVVSVRGSAYTICNNASLTVSVAECEALGDVYTNMNGANWTNKSNWMTNPDVNAWFGVTTSSYSDNPLAHYSFDGNDGSDISSNGNHGTNVGNATFTAGKFGRAVNTSSNKRIETVDTSAAISSTNRLTWSAWINRDSSTNTYNMFMGEVLPYFAHHSNGQIYFSINISGTQRGARGASVVPNGQRTHVAATYDGTTIRVYVNGVEDGSATYPGTIITYPSNQLTIGDGRNTTARYPFDGQIDEVRVYNRALSLPEIKQLYNGNAIKNTVVNLCLNRTSANAASCSNAVGISSTNANNVIGPIPSTINQLPNLNYLVMAYNQVNGVLPTTIGDLKSLSYMYLNNNSLTGPLPSTIGGLDSVINLFLYNNSINGSIPSQIANLASVQYLHLSNNSLSGPIPDLTSLNDTLYYLLLNDNSLTGPIPSWMYNMTNLRYLYLYSNSIGGTLSSSINNLINLTRLYIHSAGITGSFPELTMSDLEYLYIGGNNFGGSSLPSLPNSLDTIRVIQANGSNFAGALPSSWGSASNALYYIHLTDNSLTGPLPSSWGNLGGLTNLYLWNNNIAGQVPSSYSNLNSLLYFGIYNNDLEGELPVGTLQGMTSINSNHSYNRLGGNCFYVGNVNASQTTFLNNNFGYGGAGDSVFWTKQRACGTDLEVVSVTPVGTLQGGTTMTYTITYRNNGPRTAYDPKLTITLANGLQFSDSASSSKVISLGQMAPNANGSQIVTINKLGVAATTINYTNSFVISDTTTTDTSSANNTKTHAGTANGSAYNICLSTSLTVPQSDCEALGDLYTATAGNNWTNKTNWLTSPDVNSRFGVTVAGGRVTSLDIRSNNLVGTLPASIGNLTQLATLYLLTNAGLTGPLPSTIDQLDELTHIYINNTSINGSIPTTVGGMAKMTYFIANNANISGVPSQIANMPMLNQLQLQYNNITSLPDMTALNNTLRVFYFHGNQITGPIPSWMGNLTNLTHFYIGYNPFTSGPVPSWICNMTNLQYLYIAGNNLNGELPSCMNNNYPQLRQFQVQGNQLEGTPPTLTNASNLTHYYIHSNRFTGPLPSWFANISTFRYFYGDSNRFTGPIPDNFANMSTASIIFRVSNNYLDRDISGNALISPALQSRWNNIVVYNNDPVNYKLIGAQGDITAPLLGANAARIPLAPGFNWQGKAISYPQIVGPHGSTVVTALMGGSPHHVGYDKSVHGYNFEVGKTYTFSFRARTVAGTRTIRPGFTDDGNTNFQYQDHSLDTNWKQIHVTNTYTSGLGAGPRLFITNTAGGDFYYYDPVVTESTNLPTAIDTNRVQTFDPITDGSDFTTAGSAVAVAGGGSCSNLTVSPTTYNSRDLPQAASQFDATNGLIVHYNFDGNSTTDLAGGNNNGTPVNVSYTTAGRIADGAVESAAGGHIVHSTNGLSSTNGTISIWVKPTVLSSWGIWQTYDSAGTNWNDWISMFAWTDTLMYFRMGNGSACCNNDLTVNHSLYLTLNTWNHLTFTWQGNADGAANDTMSTYINGKLVGTRTANFQSAINAMARVGYGHARDIDGTLDDFRAYNRALSAAEVVNLYNERSINIAAQGSYAGCYLTTTDRANNTSNAVRLGDFTATFSPYAVCNNPARTIPQSECTALMDIYTSAGGANWSQKTNWNTNPDMGTWRGVTVTNGHVTQLCLNRNSSTPTNSDCNYTGLGNNLVGSLSSSIGNLPYIANLNLSNNSGLTGPIPSSIGNLVNVTQLYAINSSLNGSLPESMTNLNSLTNLYLWSNNFTGPLPSSWGTGMAAISYIHLANNQLSGPIPANWANMMSQLDNLILSNQLGTTKLNGPIPAWLGNMNVSSHLRLDSNQFTGPIPKELGNISSNNLFLNNNQLSGPIPPELANNTTMVDLRLQGNNLTGAIPDSFAGLTNLTTFYVNSNNLDRDTSNNAIISPALTSWYNAIPTKLISAQGDTTAPIIAGNTLAGTYSFDTMNYDITLTENSDIAAGGMTVTVAGGGTCNQISVVGTLTNKAGVNTIQLNFAPGANATTAYSNCTLKTTDRASLASNTINLGSFSVKLNPFPICNNVNLTVSQEQCTALMDFYTNTNGASWTNKTNWSAGTTVGNWYGITTTNSLIAQYDFTSNAADSSPSAANGTVNAGITFTAGKNGNSATFPASHAGITANIPSITKDQTICMWLKPDNLSARRNPYNKAYGGEGTITQETNGALSYYYGTNGGNAHPYSGFGTAAGVVSVGQWTHICLVRNLSSANKTVTWYIDGSGNTPIAAPYDTAGTTAGVTTIGNGYAGPYNGQIDDMRIYNRALSADEVNQLYLSNTMGAQTVTQVNFPSANNMVGAFPNVFDRLPSLTNIVINSNIGITGPIPSTLSSLSKLVEIGLSSLGLNGSLPSVLPTTLTSLSINTMPNMTAGPLPSNWSSLVNLTYLSLQNIKANGSLPSSWSSLTNLTYMHLANNDFNSQIPTSWLTALTGIGQMYWEGANIDGPLPPEMATWNTNTAYGSNYLTNNCFGTGHLTPAQVNAFDTKYTRAKWATQRKCTTDLQVSVTQAGNLTTSNAMLYTITVTNAGSRWAYAPKVTVSLGGGLKAENSSTPVLTYDTLAPGASQTQTITVVKSTSTPTTQTNVTNTFTVSDATITDTINNSVSDVEAVKKSNISSICDHYALNIPVAECEALTSLYSSTAGPSWTNKTNWLSSPNTDNWFGITTSNDDDLLAHYTFDNSNGNDESGNGNNSTPVGSPTFSAGRMGNAMNFNGSTQRVNLPTSISPTNITISTWLYRTSSAVNQGIARKQGSFAFSLYNDTIQVAPGNSWSFRNTNVTVPLNQWTHITWTYDGATMRVYKNGVQEWSEALAGTMPVTADQPFVGYDHNGRRWGGQMDDVRIYSRGLSAAEVTSLYQTANPTTDRVENVCMSNPSEATACNYHYQTSVGNNLVGTLPTTLSNLTAVKMLMFPKNTISGNLPTQWSSLSSLDTLDVAHNNISGTIPTTWGSMSSLARLAVSNNANLGGAIPSQLSTTSLTTLWANNNSFTSLPDLSQRNRGQLQLGGNNLSGPLSSWIGTEAGLLYLVLNNNQFTGPIPTTWGGLQNLQLFYINDNTNLVGDFSNMSGPAFGNLTYFQVQNNNFDRDPANNAIVPANIAARIPSMITYNIQNQGDVTAPVLAGGSLATNADDVVQVTFTLTEGSSTTGAGYPDGLTVGFTGNAKCATLTTSPVKLLNKGSLKIDIIGAAGQYPSCKLYVVDRAGLTSNLLTLATITIPNYAICGTVTDITRSDCKALVDIYESTAGTGWTNKTNWMGLGDATPTTASDWFGVTLTNSRVTTLNLNANGVCGWGNDATSNNLVGTLPATIGNLTGLVTLCIARNPSLVGGLPASINNLSAITNIIVQQNGLGGTIPDVSGINPTVVIMHNNGFTGPVPSLANWSNISYLYLYSNNLSGPLPQMPATMPSLHTLYFTNNNFSGYLPASYASLINIKRLYLNSNSLTGPIPESRGALTQMTNLYLQDNDLKGLVPNTFANLTSLNNNGSYMHTNCLSSSSSYMTAGLQSILTSKFNNYTTQSTTCGNDIRTTVWNDTNNNGQRDKTETLISGVTATLRACTDQTPYNTSEKLLNREMSSYYSFDTDNTIDDSDNSNSMVNSNVTYADGRISRAASFAGNGYLLKNNYNNFPTTQITTAFWVKTTDASDGLISYASSNTYNNDWLLFNSPNIIVHVRNASVQTNVSVADNQWHHVVITWNSVNGETKVYKDNVLAYNGIFAQGSYITPGGSLAIGGEQDALGGGWDNAQAHNGLMDDVRIYNRVLSASEVSQLYQSTSPQTPVNIPIGYGGAGITAGVTAADGTATMTNRAAGRYYIEYTNIPAGYKFTTQNVGGAVNIIGSDVNPWSAKTSCFELHNGTDEMDIDAGLVYLPYSSCEASTPAATPILLGQPVQLSIGGYGTNGQIQAINSSSAVVLNQSITNQGTNRGLKTWTYSWTPTTAGTYTISGAVDGYNYKLEYYNNTSLGTTSSCPYRVITAGQKRCAVQTAVAPYAGASITNVNQIATIPEPIAYCSAGDLAAYTTCSTAGDQPAAMVVKIPGSCTSSLVVTSDVNVMCDAVTDMQPAECKALISLYDSTAGASWTTKTNWRFLGDTTPRTACDWHGVTCAGGRVTQISMSNNNLTGPLPSLSGLSALTDLTLNINKLNGSLSTTLHTQLPALSTLNLAQNNLVGSLPTQWSTWSSIRTIELSQNGLTGIIPTQWSSLVNLVQFRAWANNFSGQLPTTWSTMTKLQYFLLSSTSINGNLPTTWSNMTGMQQFMIIQSQLTGTIPSGWFSNMKAMNLFQVWNNDLDGPIPATGFQLWTNLISAGNTSAVGSNCMGITHLGSTDQSYLNIKFPTSLWGWTNSAWNQQKICATDLQLSLLSKVGSLEDANSITYTFKYTNAGSRWSYNTILGLATDSRIGVTTGSTAGVTKTGINLGILAPGTSGTVTFVVDKSGFGSGIYNNISTNFSLTDTTISDSVSNHTYSDTNLTVDVSNYVICNNPSLTIPIKECKNLMGTYDALGGSSWTNKSGWGTDPTVDNWYGVKTNASMVAYYPLNGNANDSSISAKNGTTSSVTYTSGKYSTAAQFVRNNGSNINIGNTEGITSNVSDLTLSSWVKLNVDLGNSSNNYEVFSSELFQSYGWIVRIGDTTSQSTAGRVYFRTSRAGTFSAVQSEAGAYPDDGGWHLVTVTKKGGDATLYVDGEVVASATNIADPVNTTNSAYIGGNGQRMNGILDEVRIFNRALTSAEVMQLYQSNALAESTSSANRVISLSLGSNNLNGAFPSIMTNLTGLTHVDMLNKPGAGALPSLSTMTNLRWLRCDNCAINGSLPTTINSTKLTTLSLSGNQISALTPNLYNTPTLQTVILSSNPIGGTLPTGFTSLSALKTLRLDSASFTGAVPASWSGMVNLQELGLSNNNLKQELPTALQYLTGLQRLYFNNNELDGPIPEWLTGFTNLQ